MRNDVAMGKNRTGIALSPIDSKEMMNTAGLTVPTDGDGDVILANARAEYVQQGDVIGTIPPPVTVKGVASSGVQMMMGKNASVLVDKLGERLAFERTGTRLYGALVDKCAASEPLPGGPTVEDLKHIQEEELEHFHMVREAMVAVGADPTAMTPSADVQAVASMGLLQVVSDPRMTLKQSLEAILVAELIDNDCWPTLIELVTMAGFADIAKKFETARLNEVDHLTKVRTWVQEANRAAVQAPPAVKGTS